jgi:hypothetical protein
METQNAFVLGFISGLLLISIVCAFIIILRMKTKIKVLESNSQAHDDLFHECFDRIQTVQTEISEQLDERTSHIYSYIDSRIDKLQNTVVKQINS